MSSYTLKFARMLSLRACSPFVAVYILSNEASDGSAFRGHDVVEIFLRQSAIPP